MGKKRIEYLFTYATDCFYKKPIKSNKSSDVVLLGTLKSRKVRNLGEDLIKKCIKNSGAWVRR